MPPRPPRKGHKRATPLPGDCPGATGYASHAQHPSALREETAPPRGGPQKATWRPEQRRGSGRKVLGWVGGWVENKGRRARRREGNSTESPKADLILTQGQGPVPEGPLRMLCPEPGGLAALPHRTRRSSALSLLQALAPGLVTASSDAQTLPALPSTGPPGPERQPRFSQLPLPPARERAPAHTNWDPVEGPACGEGFSSVSITEATRNWVPWTAWGRTWAPSPSHLSWSRAFLGASAQGEEPHRGDCPGAWPPRSCSAALELPAGPHPYETE